MTMSHVEAKPMFRRRWKTVLAGMGGSALITMVFFGVAKLLVGPVADRLGEQYHPENNVPPRIWFVENANMAADSIIPDFLFLFSIFWMIFGLFGRGSRFPSITSLVFLAIAVLDSFYFSLNFMFDWYNWSCFEEPYTHSGFDFTRIFECPSRDILLDCLIDAQLGLVAVGAIVAVYHSRKRAQDITTSASGQLRQG